jgi:hypothetical protein
MGGNQQVGFLHETATSFMIRIMVAMGVPFALTGLEAFMN